MNTKLKIFKISDINMDNIFYCAPSKLKNQITIPLTLKFNNTYHPLFVQLPELYLNGITQQDLLILSLVSKNEQLTQNVSKFLNEFDEKIQKDLKSLLQKTRNYFPNDNWTKKFVYSSLINTIDDNNDQPANCALKLLMKHNNHVVKIYNDDHELLSNCNMSDYIGCYVSTIIELNSVVISDNEICVYIKPHQLKLSQIIKNYSLDEYSFVDSDSEPKNLENLPVSIDTEYFDNEITPDIIDYDTNNKNNTNNSINDDIHEIYDSSDTESVSDPDVNDMDIKRYFSKSI